MRCAAFIATLSIGTCLAAAAADSEVNWRPLFNGIDLVGWQQVGPGRFVIENGVMRTEGGMGLMWYTREKLADTSIRVVFQIPNQEHTGNAGVFIRIPTEPKDPWTAVNTGYEVQIDEHGDDFHRTGVLYSFTKAKVKPELRDWNTMEIELAGDRTIVSVNGEVVTDFQEGDRVPEKQHSHEPERGTRPRAGYIGLQNHGPRDVVLFKEISVKR